MTHTAVHQVRRRRKQPGDVQERVRKPDGGLPEPEGHVAVRRERVLQRL